MSKEQYYGEDRLISICYQSFERYKKTTSELTGRHGRTSHRYNVTSQISGSEANAIFDTDSMKVETFPMATLNEQSSEKPMMADEFYSSITHENRVMRHREAIIGGHTPMIPIADVLVIGEAGDALGEISGYTRISSEGQVTLECQKQVCYVNDWIKDAVKVEFHNTKIAGSACNFADVTVGRWKLAFVHIPNLLARDPSKRDLLVEYLFDEGFDMVAGDFNFSPSKCGRLQSSFDTYVAWPMEKSGNQQRSVNGYTSIVGSNARQTEIYDGMIYKQYLDAMGEDKVEVEGYLPNVFKRSDKGFTLSDHKGFIFKLKSLFKEPLSTREKIEHIAMYDGGSSGGFSILK